MYCAPALMFLIEEGNICMKKLGATIIALVTLKFEAIAQQATQKFLVEAASVVSGEVLVIQAQKGWISSSTKSRRLEISELRIGDQIDAFDRTIRISFIVVQKHDRDIVYRGELITRAGTFSCIAFERPDDYPDERDLDRAWVRIQNCGYLARER